MSSFSHKEYLQDGSVLIVSENLDDLHWFGQVLGDSDINVYLSLPDEVSIPSTETSPPDLILVDISLAESNIENIRDRLKCDKSRFEVPIIFISHENNKNNQNIAIEKRAYDYIEKSYGEHEVVTRVESHIMYCRMQHLIEQQRSELHQYNGELAKRTENLISLKDKLSKLLSKGGPEVELNFSENTKKSKHEFLAIMSHALKTPMSVVLGMADLLLETDLKDDQYQYVNSVLCSGKQVLSLIDDQLEVSGLESGTLSLDEGSFDIFHFSNQVEEMVTPLLSKSKVNFNISIDDNVPRILSGDAIRLQQVLTKLILNSFKFSGIGSVELIVDLVSIVENVTTLRFLVKDTGTGMNEDEQKEIFKPFFEGETKYQGTRVGPEITDNIVKLLGGELIIKSEQDTTIITLTVPFKNCENALKEQKAKFKGKSIHLMCGESTKRKLFWQILNEFGATVTWHNFQNGYADAIAKSSPDLILIDIENRLSSLEIGKKLRELNELHSTPVTIFSDTFKGSEISDAEVSRLNLIVKSDLHWFDQVVFKEHVEPEIVKEETQQSSKHIKLLLAEDSKANIELFSLYFRDSNYDLEVAMNGAEALSAFMHGHFDVVLMDIQMPVMDGYTSTRKIRDWEREHHMDHTPILALSAHALEEDKNNSIKAGCDDHIAKPVRKKQLLDRLKKYVEAA